LDQKALFFWGADSLVYISSVALFLALYRHELQGDKLAYFLPAWPS
jgi:hypothetical protein